jgi:DNA polymerase-1
VSTRLLIDGDVLVYKFASALVDNITFSYRAKDGTKSPTGVQVQVADHGRAEAVVGDEIERLCEAAGADEYNVILSALGKYWRSEVYSGYKSHRGGTHKPILYHPLREYFTEEHAAVCYPRLEGDDTLVLMQHDSYPGKTIIASVDKDLMTVPGTHFNWNKTERGVFEVSEREALDAFFNQVLTGDSSDGYPGCPKIGPVKAAALLKGWTTEEDAWDRIVKAYKKAGQEERHALMNARCAHLLRPFQYDEFKHRVRLWQPPAGRNLPHEVI